MPRTAANRNSEFPDRRKNQDALCFVEQRLRNVIRRVQDIFQYRASLLQTALLIRKHRRGRRRRRRRRLGSRRSLRLAVIRGFFLVLVIFALGQDKGAKGNGNEQETKQFSHGGMLSILHQFVQCARARTRVTSSGCSAEPIHSSTAAVTISEIRARGSCRFACRISSSRASPNSPNSFSGSVTPSL